MKFLSKIPILFFLSACTVSSNPPEAAVYMLSACQMPAHAGEKIWPAAKNFFGASLGQSVCTEPVSSGLKMQTPLRIIPYKNGLVDVELSCERQDAKAFFAKNAGKLIVFVAGSHALGSARIPEIPFIDRCAILGQPGLKEAIATCEVFAESMSLDKKQCWEPCSADDGSWACIVHK